MADYTENDLLTIINAAILRKGHAGHHIESMNYFVERGIQQIITEFYKWDNHIENSDQDAERQKVNKDIESFHYEVTYPRVEIKTTKIYSDKTEIDLTPQNARNTDRTYGATLSVDIKIKITPNMRPNVRTKNEPKDIFLKDQKLSIIPIAIKSDMCVLSKYSREALFENGEDPKDPGGYTIIGGKEWVINCLENSWFNAMSIYKNTKHEDELVRGTIIAKEGDAFENTYQNRFYLRQGSKIDYSLTIGKSDEIKIPFFTLFRIFGICSDKEITELIMGDHINSDSQQSIILRNTVEEAFHANYGNVYNKFKEIFAPEKNALMIELLSNSESADKIRESEEFEKVFISKIFKHFDEKVLQQYGSSQNSRHMKAIITGKYIRDIILAHNDVVPTSDRDSFQVKRIHAAGITLAKAFKQQFNKMIHMRIRQTIEHLLLSGEAFESADFAAAIKNTIIKDGPKLETALSSSISRGDETFTVRGQEVTNRVSSQLLQHKNDLNVISALNVVTAAGAGSKAAKATERADLMRRNHASSLGFICPNYSADTGEPVGINKSLACTAQITLSSSSITLENFIKNNKDPESKMISLTDIPRADFHKYCLVSINGKYIGFCENQMQFVRRYREYRRKGMINKYISIVAEPTVSEVTFWTDYGRLIRPVIIVYNNIEEIFKAADKNEKIPEFKQWTLLTRQHILDLRAGRITLDTLIESGVMEFISASEQFNCYMTTLDEFKKNQKSIIHQYTHVDIAQAILGIISLASPMADHSSCVRITFSTNHVKQACNRYNAAWPHRFDNGSYFAYKTEMPLISTLANNYMYPSAQNMMIAVAIHGGRNQEDSGDVNRACIDRGVHNGIYLKTVTVIIPNDVILGLYDSSKTSDIPPKAIFTKLDASGIIKKGSIIKQNTVLVSMCARLNQSDTYIYTDKSHIHNDEDEYRVQNVILAQSTDSKGNKFVRILMYTTRHLGAGSKTSSRMGNKSIISVITKPGDMPYTCQGIQPDMIANPHSFPSRMAISQCLEGTLATYAAHKGCFLDCTTFKKLDIDEVMKRLVEVKAYGPDGLDAGYHVMYNGRTGERMPVKIFMAPQVYQRLNKFVENAYYAIESGPVFASTQQPLQGKKHRGGLRLGEMEQATLCGHGSMYFLNEKFREDSDGYDMYVCGRCNYRAVVNENNNIYHCKKCKDLADIRRIPSCFVSNQFMHLMDACNLDMKLMLAD